MPVRSTIRVIGKSDIVIPFVASPGVRCTSRKYDGPRRFEYYQLRLKERESESSLNINNNNPVILEHLGDIYVKLNKSSEAVNIYEKVLSIDSDNQLIKDKINKIYE